MAIRVEGGDWKVGRRVRIHSALFKGPTAISLPTGLAFGMERIAKASLASVRLVTEQMRNEALNKVGAGVVGGVLLGPLGLIAGAVIGRGQTSQLVILETTDGRSALLRCKPSDLSRLLALGVGSKTPTSSAAMQQSALAPALRSSGSAAQLLASAPARWALEGVGWLALFLVIGISTATEPVIGLGLCLLAVLLGAAIWWRRELRSRLGVPRAVGLVVIGSAFLLPVLFYSIAGAPTPPPPEQQAAQTDDRNAPQAVAPPPHAEPVAVSAEPSPISPAFSEQDRAELPLPPGIIGQWCDVVGAFAREMTIQESAEGPVLVSRYSGGQVGRQPLRLRGTTYWVGDSGDVGDRLRVAANGALQLIDDDGPIRVAPRRPPGQACF